MNDHTNSMPCNLSVKVPYGDSIMSIMEFINSNESTPSLTIVDIHQAAIGIGQTLPIFTSHIQAGFPSPADNYVEKALDLNELVVQRPAATFYVRVQGDSMQQAGIFSGDILVVDRSLTAHHKSIVVAVLGGEFTVKRLILDANRIVLLAENPAYAPIHVNEGAQFEIWGVVTYVIHKAT